MGPYSDYSNSPPSTPSLTSRSPTNSIASLEESSLSLAETPQNLSPKGTASTSSLNCATLQLGFMLPTHALKPIAVGANFMGANVPSMLRLLLLQQGAIFTQPKKAVDTSAASNNPTAVFTSKDNSSPDKDKKNKQNKPSQSCSVM